MRPRCTGRRADSCSGSRTEVCGSWNAIVRCAAVSSPAPSSPVAPHSHSVLEAVLERITYANEETGYTIARVATDRTVPDLLTVVGPLLGAQVGEACG